MPILRKKKDLRKKPLILYLVKPSKEQTKPKVNRRKEIIKIRTEEKEKENRKTIENIKNTEFFNDKKIENSKERAVQNGGIVKA